MITSLYFALCSMRLIMWLASPLRLIAATTAYAY